MKLKANLPLKKLSRVGVGVDGGEWVGEWVTGAIGNKANFNSVVVEVEVGVELGNSSH